MYIYIFFIAPKGKVEFCHSYYIRTPAGENKNKSTGKAKTGKNSTYGNSYTTPVS